MTEEAPRVYQGMPVSKGVATGRMAVCLGHGLPGSLRLHTWYKDYTYEGDILFAHMTTPDMVPYIKRFAGIVTVQGGILCHAAIIAREFKIPAVVGVAALAALSWGDSLYPPMVTVDGTTGVVTLTRMPVKEYLK